MKKILTVLLAFITVNSFSQSTTVVISQVNGGGGGSTGTYLYDYVELHNISSTTQSLNGFSLQYGSATGNFGASTTNIYAFPAGTSIAPGKFLFIQLGPAGTAGAAFPVTPDQVTTNLTMSAASGKVVLSNQSASLACGATAGPCTLPNSLIVDLVAYGLANNGEGGTAVNGGAVLTSSQGSFRKNNGCQDTDNNNIDFDVVTAPVPRNSATAASFCGAAPPPALTAGTVSDFGSVVAGTNSASQTFNISGSDLTGFPGNITITSPSTDFQVSNNNSTWGSSTTIAYTSATLASTPVYVRFSPQSAGPKSGNVTVSGGGAASAVTVAVSGTGLTPATPTLGAGALASFGTVCVNTTGGPNSFTLNGSNLTTANIVVGPVAGYTFATTSGGTYNSSLSLTQPGGAYTQTIFVKFTPTTSTSYNGNIPVSGGGVTPINVAAVGAGANSAPSLTTGAASTITTISATLAGTINSGGCSTVTAYGIEYSTTNGFANGSGTTVAGSNLSGGNFSVNLAGLTPSTTYYYKAYAINGGGTGYGTQLSFTTLAPPPPVLSAGPLAAFGNLCLNIVGGPNSFTLSGSNLTAAPVVVGPYAGLTFSTSSAGTYTNTLIIAQPGGTFTATVFVKFTPALLQNYSGNLIVSGGGNSGITVAVSGAGINTAPSVTTGAASNITTNSAILSGSVTVIGCTAITEAGIVYSGISGFSGVNGTKVSSPLTAGTITTQVYGLVQGTKYYYRAFATSAGGTGYGLEQSFNTGSIANGLIIHSSPVKAGRELHWSLKDIVPGHYQVKIFNWSGQEVYVRDLLIQVNFIDDRFYIPRNLTKGVYTFQVGKEDVRMNKTFMIL